MTGIDRIAKERERQINVEGYQIGHDAVENADGQLANAAVVYALDKTIFDTDITIARYWPWIVYPKISCTDKTNDNILGRIRDLEKAGALIAAEIDRLQTHLTNEC